MIDRLRLWGYYAGMETLVSTHTMESIDSQAQSEYAIPALVLMEQAGLKGWQAFASYAHEKDIPMGNVVFVAGGGNNGGDSLVMAREAFFSGLESFTILLVGSRISNSIIGVRTLIESGASLDGVYCMGASYYETPEEKAENARKKIPNVGIGRATIIRRAIIDQNARIGDGCRIGIDDIQRAEGDYSNYSIHDGIIVIHKNAIIPHGTIL